MSVVFNFYETCKIGNNIIQTITPDYLKYLKNKGYGLAITTHAYNSISGYKVQNRGVIVEMDSQSQSLYERPHIVCDNNRCAKSRTEHRRSKPNG